MLLEKMILQLLKYKEMFTANRHKCFIYVYMF